MINTLGLWHYKIYQNRRNKNQPTNIYLKKKKQLETSSRYRKDQQPKMAKYGKASFRQNQLDNADQDDERLFNLLLT